MTEVRDASPADAAALGALHVRTWRESYWGVLPDQAVLRETVDGRARFWRRHLECIRGSPSYLDENVVVAVEAEGGAVGFVWTGPARARETRWDGEIYMLYVLDAAQRRGVGRLLMDAAARSLVRRGYFRIGLWVLEDNGPARAFYEALGGEPSGVRRERVAGGARSLAGYVWEDASVLLLGSIRQG